MPISRDRPLKQNIRVWFNYLQTAIKHGYDIKKEYYRPWHLHQVRSVKFDTWWKTHKHLFAHKEYVTVKVDNSLSTTDAIKEVKKQLVGKIDKKSSFHISSKKFRYKEVDDYLKCWKLRQTLVFNRKKEEYLPMTYNDIAIKIAKQYRTKTRSKKLVRRSFGVGKAEKTFDDKVLRSVKKRVDNAKMIILNTAKGQFTGKY